MAKHALLSASGAHRWLECTPSALLELQFPQSTSEYAEEGTAAHELCELTARYFLGEVSEMDFENRRDELAKGPYYNAEMQECANGYARFVTEKTKAAQESCEDAFTELEVRVDFSKYVKDGFGTGDCIIVADKVLEIVDFKYGKGVRVEATGNPQMKLYALGALLKYNTLFDIDSVRMTIFQPRLSGVQSSDEITVKELLEWAEKYVKPRAKLAYKGEGEFAPSEEVCKFCRAKAQCKARADKNLKLFDEAPDAMLLTPEEAGAILEKAADIQAWLTDLEGLVSSTLLSGQPVTGWKMVEGRSKNKTCDKKQVSRDRLERAVVDFTVRYILQEEVLEELARKVHAAQERQNDTASEIAFYEKKLADNKKSIANVLRAIESGAATQTLPARLQELENEQAVILGEISFLKGKRLAFTEDQIFFALMKHLEPYPGESEQDYRRRIISDFVSEVYLYDGRLLIYFNISSEDGKLKSADLSNIEGGEFDEGLVGSTMSEWTLLHSDFFIL